MITPFALPRRGLRAFLAGAMLLLPALLAAAPPATPAARVPPGSVVRWGGEGIESCVLGLLSWTPLDGACWYPVDLLAPPGPLELARWRHGRRETAPVEVTSYPYPVQRIELPDDSKVNLSAKDEARAGREQERVAALWGLETPRRFTLPLHPPLAPLPRGGRFGSRRVFNGQPRSPHTGADYTAKAGTPVLAAADGTVVLAEEHFFAGNSVFVDHGDGLVTMYFHLSRIAVEKGGRVRRGQTVGAVGQTGRASGPHLHFGVRWHGARIDPALLLGPPGALPEVR